MDRVRESGPGLNGPGSISLILRLKRIVLQSLNLLLGIHGCHLLVSSILQAWEFESSNLVLEIVDYNYLV